MSYRLTADDYFKEWLEHVRDQMNKGTLRWKSQYINDPYNIPDNAQGALDPDKQEIQLPDDDEPEATCRKHPGDYALEGHCEACDRDRAAYRAWKERRSAE